MATIRDWINARPVTSYVALTFLISWSLFGGLFLLPESAGLGRTVSVVGGAYGPFLAALLLANLRGEGAWRWLRSVFRVRIGPLSYLLALGIPLGGILLAGAIHLGFFEGTVTPADLPLVLEFPLYLLFVLVLGGGQEEPGWRGYLLPLLQSRYSALVSSVGIGVVWALWHLPLFVAPGTVQSRLSFWLYLPYVIALSVLLTWLVNRSGGSVVPAILLHSAANAGLNYYPAGGEFGATSPTGQALLSGVTIVLALLLVLGTGWALGRRSEAPTGPPTPRSGPSWGR